jgi:hypothetical protein
MRNCPVDRPELLLRKAAHLAEDKKRRGGLWRPLNLDPTAGCGQRNNGRSIGKLVTRRLGIAMDAEFFTRREYRVIKSPR